ncbi:hypothetical protein T8K17_00525 [Thalassobaculum sp. OXR-137]|uniref:hypothetical protein n=1 Tax=Thalassobaculum sp. OXR-137 TaxID=3100173 RepID=UPI002AC9633B|nr:hypothetical protein [Thalassobaculum sp. OXR-137]WPZ34632.1 hypothetical protein T8K17_00525 [Thalassobaculum sp. OXR-137]
MDHFPASSSRRILRSGASVVILAAALAIVQPSVARAGVVGSALETMAGWVSGIESAIATWFDSTIGRIELPDRGKSAARTVAEMAFDNPAGLAAVAERAGFRLTSISFTEDGKQVDGISFAYERAIEKDERLALWRDVLEVEATPFRPEMELVRLLLNASDMQDNRPPAGMTMTGVTITIDRDALEASWTFVPNPAG